MPRNAHDVSSLLAPHGFRLEAMGGGIEAYVRRHAGREFIVVSAADTAAQDVAAPEATEEAAALYVRHHYDAESAQLMRFPSVMALATWLRGVARLTNEQRAALRALWERGDVFVPDETNGATVRALVAKGLARAGRRNGRLAWGRYTPVGDAAGTWLWAR